VDGYNPADVIMTVPGLPPDPEMVLVPAVGPVTTLVTVPAGEFDCPVGSSDPGYTVLVDVYVVVTTPDVTICVGTLVTVIVIPLLTINVVCVVTYVLTYTG